MEFIDGGKLELNGTIIYESRLYINVPRKHIYETPPLLQTNEGIYYV